MVTAGIGKKGAEAALRWIAILAVLTLVSAPARAGELEVRSSTGAHPFFREGFERQTVTLRASLRPILLDYELPGHPAIRGRGHAGVIGTAAILWSFQEDLSIEAGVLGRLPFALDISEETGLLPILALTLYPFGRDVRLRFGSLETDHGFHPAVVDEARYAYGRSYEESYNRSLSPEAARDLGGDPFLPGEHGAQLIADVEGAHAEVFLDWQLLETGTHREKFGVGALGEVRSQYGDLSLQLRLVHYGGELFTKSDPIRFAGADPVRQPTTVAFVLRPRPLALEHVTIELPLAYVRGRLSQNVGEAPSWHHAAEVGADATFFGIVRAGYRLFLPIERELGLLSEDGDPVYGGRRSQRATIAVTTRHGAAELSGRLDLVFAAGADKVQYLTVTALTVAFEAPLFARDPGST